jgi:hypothetical protein
MKKSLYFRKLMIICTLAVAASLSGCKEKFSSPILFEKGAFPDSVINLADLNTAFHDYNMDIYQFKGNSPVVFSSNRGSSGGQFDIVQGGITFFFDQTDGFFQMSSNMTNDSFLDRLLQKANTSKDDLGPYRFYSPLDGYEYMLVSSVNTAGNLDLFYLKNRPQYGANLPDVEGPLPVTLLNTSADDGYFCFDLEQDSAYFTSSRGGNFDIYVHTRPAQTAISTWFNQVFSASAKVDSINSPGNDKCPQILKKIMVFASDRPGGMGGYDLYYSLFKKGKWSSPVNFGPGINTSSDEYRPVIGFHQDFTNYFLMFSSNRPGGKGGYDLYFTGAEFK